MVIPATNRNMNLSVILFESQESRRKSQDPIYCVLRGKAFALSVDSCILFLIKCFINLAQFFGYQHFNLIVQLGKIRG